MNITSLMPRFGRSDNDEPTEAELDQQDEDAARERKRLVPKNGPQRLKFMTSGQVRRTVARGKASEQRKANVRYRKQWMQNQHRIAVLRGQLETLGSIKTPSGQYLTGQSPESMRIVHEHLTLVYGSVENAEQRYAEILAEKS